MPDLLEPYHGDEPMQAKTDRPWITLGTDQLERIVEHTAGHDGDFRLEYGGAGYFFVRLLDSEGHPGERKIVFAIEPHAPR